MTDWTDLSSELNSGDILPSSSAQALMDNLNALVEQSSGAPFFDYMRYGVYTGDGTTSQYISGIGRDCSLVMVWCQASDTTQWGTWYKMQGWDTYCYQNSKTDCRIKPYMITDIGSDGFVVNDG